ncbi:aminoglycoside phosphotransferase (APT) family kinase protein [Hydrogenophaga palleronii]|uniref:Aminoglycoside phosphotransferase (APT) family kinase protein n=1 Tax=Hydrogenophaga palleronii TaxID=65655 RepID=A0ABU1WSN6_9BURK|nr:aminoglycoside phosphotransferase family protein [Hydrogenophaga palleronii]MDR7152047.1 aminoglycoside phosphotransferase (APT) family kinase protein [Hydrogenophaga palleronii]
MTFIIDHEMEAAARQLWPAPQRLQLATGGLFNRVVQVQSATGTTYLKRFTDSASSGDFPPLPTSASQRCLVAASWHELALRASACEPRVKVPPLIAVQTAIDLVAMDQAHGEPLYDALVTDCLETDEALRAVAAWLGAMHALPLEPRSRLLAASNPFKAFKIDLQYTRVLTEVPQSLHMAAESFIATYLLEDAEPVHGDLNSRNILIASNITSVIDFEQGHFGEGVYDLAYLISEYVIRDLRLATNPEVAFNTAWECYCEARELHKDFAILRRLRVHLAFQTLYRLVGPSRKVWTGHLTEAEKTLVRDWSIAELSTWLR